MSEPAPRLHRIRATLVGGAACLFGVALAGPTGATVQTGFFEPAAAARAKVGPSLPLGRCINLGGTLEAQDWGWQVAPEPAVFQQIRGLGFATVRLPVRWDTRVDQAGRIDPRWFAVIDTYVGRATQAGLNVIIDMHHFRDLDADPAAHADRFVALWDQIARHYADAPQSVWFELLNEPRGKLTNALLTDLYARALSRIRMTNPRRIVIAGGAIGNTVASLATFELPDDPYIVPEFHTYGPVQFTHQGASWVKPALPTPYAFEPMIALPGINAQRTALLAYMRRTGRVPVALEFGAIRFAPRADRVAYYRTISAMIASAGMYSCVWSDPTFPLQTGGVWDKELIAAIATPQ